MHTCNIWCINNTHTSVLSTGGWLPFVGMRWDKQGYGMVELVSVEQASPEYEPPKHVPARLAHHWLCWWRTVAAQPET